MDSNAACSTGIKKIFPHALFIGSEHDVSFLRLQRQYEAAKGMHKIKEGLRLRSLKKHELSSIRHIDMVVPHNTKDRDVLIAHGISPDKIQVIAPFYSDYSDVSYCFNTNAILFFGAMDRPENYESIIWFIEQVFNPFLSETILLVYCCAAARTNHYNDIAQTK